ncbi:Murein hydrolase activator NlpD precursor [Candidatus Xiphinematobacter sp. Idaho Grape]|uniref:M23 family metallopeptidase n=1 Tax=Candidatus Xiphinematobacter sp. Idaho Grape TaxID=1704307 RepID=UPI000705E4B7|nr:M23 family metallopeptidase [Candidatus Xiphinematobacter sp. Idaho Grape]ALJ56710.1 Murein hydrolase activator NlpD precursor [Candidatus Xiphinematobacter sp. Idaho Grape]
MHIIRFISYMHLVLLLTTLIFSSLPIQSKELLLRVKVPTVDGFDYPVASPNAIGYCRSQGWSKRHPGEDWVGLKGSGALLGAPVYAIGTGRVVFARNASGGWGNVVIIRHAYRENGKLYLIDSFYAHLHRVLVRERQLVARGEKVGEVGTNRGMYSPHLHFEIRKNLLIGTCRPRYARTLDNYHIPTTFIEEHRKLKRHGRYVKMLMRRFTFQNAPSLPIDESKTF